MTDEFTLAKEFPPTSEAEWRKLVEAALKGASFEKRLVTQTYDGLRVEPLYPRAAGAKFDVPDSEKTQPLPVVLTQHDVLPILLRRCTGCHGLRRQEGVNLLRTDKDQRQQPVIPTNGETGERLRQRVYPADNRFGAQAIVDFISQTVR